MKISPAIIPAAIAKAGLSIEKRTSGDAEAAPSAASDENRNRKARNSQMAQAKRPAGNQSASSVPIKVATPLPPLNLSQTGKQCPRNAAAPATSGRQPI